METTKVVTTSQAGSLNWRDLAHGLIVAVATPVFTIIINSLQDDALTFDWKNIGITALIAGLGYLSKKFFTPSQTILKS